MARDKDAWLRCFTEDALVEDPVGPSMYSADGSGHQGKEALSSFYDQSIGVTNWLEFDMVDALCGGDEIVFRGVLRVGIGEHVMDMDIVINYRVAADGRLRNLRAFWEFDRAAATMRPASAGVATEA